MDDSARERLIESHLPLVRSVARRYAGRGETLDDLVQAGAVGLIKASDRFDESRGVAFATFAAPAIEGEIRHHLRDRSTALRIPRGLQQASGELRRQRRRLAATLGHSPTAAELAAALDTDEQLIERALAAERARDTVPLSPDGESVESAGGSDQHGGSEDRLSLAGSLRGLDDRARAIVFMRFHLDMTEGQIGRKLGISQAQVSRLLSGALAQLRSELAGSDDSTAKREGTAGGGAAHPASGTPAPEEPQQSHAKVRKPTARIGGVRASYENALAHYLELPYNVAVKSERDGGRSRWSATVEELPGCTARGDTPDEAVDLLRPVMERWFAAALAEHREIPLPAGEAAKQRSGSSHSGRFLVRMPGTLHEQLARAAERERVSLNRFVINVLAASVSPTPSAQSRSPARPPEQTDGAESVQRSASRTLRFALATNLILVVLAGVAAIVLFVLALQSGI